MLNAVAIGTGTHASEVFVAGYQGTSSNGKDVLALRYSGSGSLTTTHTANYQGADDVANDIAYTTDGRLVVAGYATTSGSVRKFALWLFPATGSTIQFVHSQTGSTVGEANALCYSDGHVWATGVDNTTASPKVLTVNLRESDLTYSTDWATTQGYRIYSPPGYGGNIGLSIWSAGTNVYIGGEGDMVGEGFPPILHSRYLILRYDSAGDLPLEDYWPSGSTGANKALGVTSFCAGEAYTTGLNVAGSESNNLGTLQYMQTNDILVPGQDGFTVLVGTRTDSNTTPLDASDNTYLEVTKAVDPATSVPGVVVEIEQTIPSGDVANVSELCFEVEMHGSQGGITQSIYLYNYDSASYELFESGRISKTNSTDEFILHITVPSDPGPYISSGGVVKAKLRYTSVGALGSWGVLIDLGVWHYLAD